MGEVVALVQREVEEGDRQETDLAEVEGYDPAPGVPHEIGAVEAEAQVVVVDLGPEVDTMVTAYVRENLCQESSSEKKRRCKRDKARRRGALPFTCFFQLFDGMVSHGGHP